MQDQTGCHLTGQPVTVRPPNIDFIWRSSWKPMTCPNLLFRKTTGITERQVFSCGFIFFRPNPNQEVENHMMVKNRIWQHSQMIWMLKIYISFWRITSYPFFLPSLFPLCMCPILCATHTGNFNNEQPLFSSSYRYPQIFIIWPKLARLKSF